MAITDINVTGYVFQDDGDPLEGATVELLETGTTTVEATYSGGTTSAGLWTFTEASLDTTYDIKITSATSIRKRMWADEITLKTVDVSQAKIRGTEGAAAPLYFFADQADDAGDAWRIQASASDALAIGSDKASAGTIIDYLTITNGANAAASTVTVGGILTVTTTLDVNGTADYDVTDYDIASSGDIDLLSTNDAVAAIYLRANGGTSETIKLHADQGTSVTEGAESVTILSDAGGVGIRSTANLANAVNITVDGGTTSTMTLFNDQGTTATEGAASIQLLSDVGGINIKSGLNGANAILLTADGGTSETILVHADQGTGTGSIELLSDAGGIELDAGADIILDAGGADIFLKDDGTLFGTLTNSSGELVIKSSSSGTTAMTFSGADVSFSGTVTIGSAAISEAELEILDGATVTTAELNLIDGGTSRGTTAVASGDGILINDNGTMAMTNVDTVSTYFASHSVGGGNIVTTGALDSGSITSGFDTIDTGSSTITTTGVITAGGITIGSAAILEAELEILDGASVTTTELNYNDTGAAVGTVVASKTVTVDSNKDVASFRNITLTGELDAGSLDISGDADIDGTLETDALTVGGTNVLTGSLITTLGTISAGVWQGTDVGVAHGGTGASTLASNSVLTGTGASAITAEANLTFDGTAMAVGSSSTGSSLTVENDASSHLILRRDSDAAYHVQVSGGSGGTNRDLNFQLNAAFNNLILDALGDITIGGSNYNTGSDERIKTNVQTIPSALSKVIQMRGISYDSLVNGDSSVGLIAQELELIAPEVVTTSDIQTTLLDGTRVENTKSISYSNLVAYLIEAVKELTAEIRA